MEVRLFHKNNLMKTWIFPQEKKFPEMNIRNGTMKVDIHLGHFILQELESCVKVSGWNETAYKANNKAILQEELFIMRHIPYGGCNWVPNLLFLEKWKIPFLFFQQGGTQYLCYNYGDRMSFFLYCRFYRTVLFLNPFSYCILVSFKGTKCIIF